MGLAAKNKMLFKHQHPFFIHLGQYAGRRQPSHTGAYYNYIIIVVVLIHLDCSLKT